MTEIEFVGDVSAPVISSYLFLDLINVKEIKGLTNLNTSEVTIMNAMFLRTQSLTSLDVSNFDTSKVIHMGSLFYNNYLLTNLDLSNFNTSNVISMDAMFMNNSKLVHLDLSNFDTSKVYTMNDMFKNTNSLNKIELGSKTKFNNTINLPNKNRPWVLDNNKWSGSTAELITKTQKNPVAGTYESKYDGYWGNVPYTINKDKTKVTFVNSEKFDNQLGDVSTAPWNIDDTLKTSITDIEFTGDIIAPNNSEKLFSSLFKLTTISGLNHLNTDNVTTMAFMFSGLDHLTTLNLSNFDTTSTTYLGNMFYDSNKLESLTLGSKTKLNSSVKLRSSDTSWTLNSDQWAGKTSELISKTQTAPEAGTYTVSNTVYWGNVPYTVDNEKKKIIFNAASVSNPIFGTASTAPWALYSTLQTSLEEVEIIGNVFAPLDSSYLFSTLENVTEFKGLSHLDTSTTTHMSYMFSGMKQLTEMDLSNMNTSNVIDMSGLFSNMAQLTVLKLGSETKLDNTISLHEDVWKTAEEELVGTTSRKWLGTTASVPTLTQTTSIPRTLIWQKIEDSILGDITVDGVVDILDYAWLTFAINNQVTPYFLTDAYFYAVADMNQDGVIDESDRILLLEKINSTRSTKLTMEDIDLDINGDGVFDMNDIEILESLLQTGTSKWSE